LKPWILLFLLTLAIVGCASSEDDDNSATDSANATTVADTVIERDQTTSTTAAPEDIAARVNGRPITIQTLETAVMSRAVVAPAGTTEEQLRSEVLEDLIDQHLIEQFAAVNGIQVDPTAVQDEIALLQTQVEANGGTLTALLGLPTDTDREVIEQEIYNVLLNAAVEEYIFANATLDTQQVNARHIVVNTEAEARDLLGRLQAGEDFAALAAQYSLDRSTADAGGDLGFVARGDLLQPAVEDVVFALPPNSRHPAPVQSELGWHIIEVSDRDDTTALTQTQVLRQRQQIFQDWLADQRMNATIERFIS
jgi:peptidyl-prolyl cis-trans isomerase C